MKIMNSHLIIARVQAIMGAVSVSGFSEHPEVGTVLGRLWMTPEQIEQALAEQYGYEPVVFAA